MKPCHAALLAVVGWYLMVPPVNEPPSILDPQKSTTETPVILRNAPLSDWRVLDTFESNARCEQERRNLARYASAVKDPDLERQAGAFAQCIGK
jgi:hypothetical protein